MFNQNSVSNSNVIPDSTLLILAWESINDHSQPSEVAPIDMDTTANPWESARAASSPTPGI